MQVIGVIIDGEQERCLEAHGLAGCGFAGCNPVGYGLADYNLVGCSPVDCSLVGCSFAGRSLAIVGHSDCKAWRRSVVEHACSGLGPSKSSSCSG